MSKISNVLRQFTGKETSMKNQGNMLLSAIKIALEENKVLDLFSIPDNLEIKSLHSNDEFPDSLFIGLESHLYSMKDILSFIDKKVSSDKDATYNDYVDSGFFHSLRIIEDRLSSEITNLLKTEEKDRNNVFHLTYSLKKAELYLGYIKDIYRALGQKNPSYLKLLEECLMKMENRIKKDNGLMRLDEIRKTIHFYPGMKTYSNSGSTVKPGQKKTENTRLSYKKILTDIFPF
ncbi:MAG: hypothetical protein PHS92_00680 [Candidatus Gracilibacteria bacterium]|nr:hypothetical protein [Candidatus Gracilibacteria bacterium]